MSQDQTREQQGYKMYAQGAEHESDKDTRLYMYIIQILVLLRYFALNNV